MCFQWLGVERSEPLATAQGVPGYRWSVPQLGPVLLWNAGAQPRCPLVKLQEIGATQASIALSDNRFLSCRSDTAAIGRIQPHGHSRCQPDQTPSALHAWHFEETGTRAAPRGRGRDRHEHGQSGGPARPTPSSRRSARQCWIRAIAAIPFRQVYSICDERWPLSTGRNGGLNWIQKLK